ncbi:MAG: hypothetical protein AABZ76_02060 [Pseudomonadota bacterium]
MNGNETIDLSRFGLGPRLDTRAMPDNPWLACLEWDAVQVLAAVSKTESIAFAFTESMYLQAGASTASRQILVSGSLGDMLCRLCAAIVGAGVFIKLGNPSVEWTPETGAASVRSTLDSEPFRWSPAFIPWHGDEERVQLFLFLLVQAHRFVLLHEAGHILHRHGPSAEPRGHGAIIDGRESSEADEAAAASSMARELVADAEAFHLHFQLLDHQFAQAAGEPMGALLAEKLVGTPRERLRMTLLSAFLIFQILDYRTWSIETARLRTHPPAPFRVKAIYATAVDLKHPGITQQELIEEIGYARLLGSVVVDVGLNRLPQLSWLNQVDGTEFDELFLRIYAEMHKWADPALLKSG